MKSQPESSVLIGIDLLLNRSVLVLDERAQRVAALDPKEPRVKAIDRDGQGHSGENTGGPSWNRPSILSKDLRSGCRPSSAPAGPWQVLFGLLFVSFRPSSGPLLGGEF